MSVTADVAPADKTLYALRDVTATVESVPLITASILSKKLAEGISGLVMDVKCGSGAFCDTEEMARDLAQSLVAVANQAGLPTVALITDMDRVLGREVGNALEIAETVAYLKGEGARETRLHEVTMALAGEMLLLGDPLPATKLHALGLIARCVPADALEAEGFRFYRWTTGPRPLIRLVGSFETTTAEVDALLGSAKRHSAG